MFKMFKYILYLKIVFCCLVALGTAAEPLNVALHPSVNTQPASEVKSLARYYRKDSSLAPEVERERLMKILARTYDILPHYDIQDELKDTVKQFVVDSLSIDIGDIVDFNVLDSRTTEFYGKSEDIVFLVQDQNNHVRYVVKAFQNPCQLSGRMINEISAMELIREMQMPGVVPIEPIAFAIGHDNDKEYGLLLETTAPGKRLDQYIFAIGKEKVGSDERKRILEVAKTAFRRMGESLALLHSVKSAEKLRLHASSIAKFDNKFEKVLKNPLIMGELSQYLSPAALTDYVKEVKSAAVQVPLFHTYIHNDTNLGNIFYDDQQDTVSFIDLHGMHQSIDIMGQPMSDPTIDLIRAEDSLRKKASHLLVADETKSLITTFYDGYQDFGGMIPDKNHWRFYKTSLSLWKLTLGIHYLEEKDPERKALDKASFIEGIEYFRLVK